MKHVVAIMTAVCAVLITAVSQAAEKDSCLVEARQAIQADRLDQAQQILTDHLQHTPDDSDAQFELSRVWSWQKKWEPALDTLTGLIDHFGENSDYLLARARLYEWMQRPDAALVDLDKARQQTPEYLAVWQQQIKLLSRASRQDESKKQRLQQILAQARNRFPDEDWNIPTAEVSTTDDGQTSLEAYYGHDALTNNRAAWNNASIKLSHKTKSAISHVQIDTFDRFDKNDWQMAGGINLPLQDTWRLAVNGSLSPTTRVIARNKLEAIISKTLTTGFILHGGLQYANYAATNSKQLHITSEYYHSAYRFAYTFRLIDVDNAGTGNNQRIQLSRSYGTNNMIGVSIAGGKDVEFDGTATPPVSSVRTYALYGRHSIEKKTALTYSIFHHQQGVFYNRNGFVLGIKFDF